MRRATVILLGITTAFRPAAHGDSVANGLRLPGGTPVLLRLKAAISSSDAHVNDRVEFRVARDVRVGPATVIPKDSAAWAVVTEASPRGRMARAGKLSMNIQAACSADGQAVPLRLVARPDARVEQTGSESGLGDTLLAFPAWPVMLFLYGKDRHMPAGAEVTAYTDRDVTIDPLLMDSGGRPGTCGAAPRDAVPVTDASIAMVRSDPDGAEIQVDGKYVGNTPSRLRLTAGDHDIRVSAKGRHAWRRIITTTAGGEISVSAVLGPDVGGSGSRVDPQAALAAVK